MSHNSNTSFTYPIIRSYSRRKLLKIAGAGAVAYAGSTLATACSIGNNGSSTDSPIRIGVLLPYTGIYAALGDSIAAGLEMYLDEIGNQASGRNIEIIAEDTEMKPDIAQQKARKLVEQDKVDIVAGIVSTGVLYGLREYFHNNKKILICANAGGNKISRDMKSPYIWRSSFSNWQPNWPLGLWAYENVSSKVFMSAPDYGAGHNMVDAFAHSFQSAGGMILGKQFTPFPSMGDPAPFITEIRKSRPPMVFCFYSGSAAVAFVKAYNEFGLTKEIPLVCSGFTVEEDVLPAQGSAAVGARSGLHWALLLDNPTNRQFTTSYKNRTNTDANVFAVQGYDTGKIIAHMLNEVQGDTSNTGRMLDSLHNVSFSSPRGSFRLDPKSQNPTQHIYVREVKEIGEKLHNVVIEDLGEFTDPGDNSLG
jgi:branched-chain amino acid transport system substrate-binding protein